MEGLSGTHPTLPARSGEGRWLGVFFVCVTAPLAASVQLAKKLQPQTPLPAPAAELASNSKHPKNFREVTGAARGKQGVEAAAESRPRLRSRASLAKPVHKIVVQRRRRQPPDDGSAPAAPPPPPFYRSVEAHRRGVTQRPSSAHPRCTSR